MSQAGQKQVNAFFVRRDDSASVLAAVAERQPSGRGFSVFIAEDLQAAVKLADDMAAAADAVADPDAAVAAALQVADAARGASPGGLVDHAAKLFLTHHRSARNVRIPNLMSRMRVRGGGARPRLAATEVLASVADAETPTPKLGGTTGSAEEDKLNWFREDPLANEHHEHWHLVYVRFDSASFRVRPRHGELFFYMHQQMLARYDAERLAAGLAPVAPFADYTAEVIAYDPGALEIGDTNYVARPAGQRWQPLADIDNYGPADHAERRDRFYAGIAALALQVPGEAPVPLAGAEGSDILGHTNENGQHSVSGDQFRSHYGNHHGFGHVLTAALSDATVLNRGVMYNPASAIRDPFFWQWHRHVDDINFAYQEKLAPHAFDDVPQVVFGGGPDDNGLAIFDTIRLRSAAARLGYSAEGLVAALLGGDRFETSFPAGLLTLADTPEGPVQVELRDTLETELRGGIFQLETEDVADAEPRFSYPYLWHPSYHFGVRIRSTAATAQTVTVRLFLCPAYDAGGGPDSSLNDRRSWIELDKFEAALEPGAAAVLTRADTDSTIVRRPVTSVQANPDFVRDLNYGAQGEDHPDASACECGWPYHLLYPRGTKAGMRFAFLAIVTHKDRLARQGQCGSMSFCAVTDEYPDAKPMGYPFDRPLAAPLAQLVADNPSFALRFITIQER